MIWQLWRLRPGSVVVPGHDLPMTQENGRMQYLGQREAAITAWYGNDMEQMTLFEPTLPVEAAAAKRASIA